MQILSMSKITENHSLTPAQVQTLRVDLWNFNSLLNALVLAYHDRDSLLGSKFVYFQGAFLRLNQHLDTSLNLYWGLLQNPIKNWSDISQALMIGMKRDDGLDYMKSKFNYLAVSLETLSGCAVVPDAEIAILGKVIDKHLSNMYDKASLLRDVINSDPDNAHHLDVIHFACITGIERTLGIIKQLATYKPVSSGEEPKCTLNKGNIGAFDSAPQNHSVLATAQHKKLIIQLAGLK